MGNISIKNMTKSFGNVTVLNQINLEIEHNDITVLVGPSGCGKTTLMRCIVGFEQPQEGDVLIDGKSVLNVKPKDRGIAMVFQYYSLYPNMNVRQNLSVALEYTTELGKEEINAKVEDIARLLEIRNLLDRKPSQLSGGEAQRVAIGRALIRNPEIIFLDEPLSAVDAKLRRELRVEIRSILKKFDVTAIYVTHDQEEAMAIADTMVLMGKGEIYDMGAPEFLYNNPSTKYSASLLGRPSMNLFPLSVAHKGESAVLSGNDISISLTDGYFKRAFKDYDKRQVWVGVRPIHMNMRASGDDGAMIKATLRDTENLGDEMYIYMNNETADFVAKVPVDDSYSKNPIFGFDVNENDLHLFDMDTEQRLTVQA